MTPLAIDKVLSDPRLLGAGLGDIETWATWIIVLKAAFALPLTDEERKIFAAIAGGRVLPLKRVRELWCAAGRRGGKITHGCCARGLLRIVRQAQARCWRARHGAGAVDDAGSEQGRVRLRARRSARIAGAGEGDREHDAQRDQAQERHRHRGASQQLPQVRGRTLCACIFDEVAYWRDDTTATPDTEIYTAVLPACSPPTACWSAISLALSPHWSAARQAQAVLRRR